MKRKKFVIVMRYGSSDEYRILFIDADSMDQATYQAYNRDRGGSIVAKAQVP